MKFINGYGVGINDINIVMWEINDFIKAEVTLGKYVFFFGNVLLRFFK